MTDLLSPVALRLLGLFLFLGAAVRLTLLRLATGIVPPGDSSAAWPAHVLLQGFRADLLIAVPLAILFAVLARRARPRVTGALAYLAVAVMLLVSIAELFFWNEFQSRLDRLVFHYLAYPREVLTFLEDQFYLSLYALPFLGLGALLTVWVIRPLREPGQASGTRRPLGLAAIVAVLLAASFWPAALPPGRVAPQLASNGYLGIARAALTDERRWTGRYPGDAHPPSAGSKVPTTTPASLQLAPAPTAQRPKHLVLIIMESFAGETWQDPALRAQYLPNFSRLATRSWSFTNIFASGSRTTRGMEALLNGMLPLPGVSTSQRPDPQRLPSLPRALTAAGWHSGFVYAGWPDFSDLTAYWQAIGFEHTTDRRSFAGEDLFQTSWGYADEHLFERLQQEMTVRVGNHERVFLAALTLSHHRPYDYPAQRVPWPADERRSEFAMAYADWALGRFMNDVQAMPWYDDTLFVIAADHGAHFRGNASIPVDSYRVPLLLHGPAVLGEPRQIDHLGSLVEVPRTVLGILGLQSSENFYGTSLLDGNQALVPVEHDYDVGLVDPGGVTVLRRDGAAERWDWQPKAGARHRQKLVPGEPEAPSAARVYRHFKQAHERYYGRQAEHLEAASALRR
jgi:phosphoglycerol transferase MdoB-like AlkP superfamily enzyme